jgi:hypothetical protein
MSRATTVPTHRAGIPGFDLTDKGGMHIGEPSGDVVGVLAGTRFWNVDGDEADR